MKTLTRRLTVGKTGQGIDMYATMSLDGKPLRRFKCDSMVGNFALFLHGNFHGGKTRRPHLPYTSTSNEEVTDINEEEASEGGMTTRIRTGDSGMFSDDMTGENFFYIYGATDERAWLNGFYRIEQYSTNAWALLFNMDGSVVPFEGGLAGSLGYGRRVRIAPGSQSIRRTEGKRFQSWWPLVGADNTPVKVSDMWLHDYIRDGEQPGELSNSGKNTTALTTNKPSSRFNLSRSFTNQTAEDITVRELGIACDDLNGWWPGRARVLLARDTLDTGVVVPPAKTLTVDYEIIVELSPDTQDTDVDGTNGGFTANFMNRLRAISTFSGNDDGWEFYNMAAAGGTSSANAADDYMGWHFGLQVGADNTFTSMTDETLLDLIVHGDRGSLGDQGPQLWYGGMDIGDVVYDEVANKASFSLRRLFENKTDEPIVIKEMGLRGNYRTDNSFSIIAQYARTALHPDDQLTMQPGEFALVEYLVEVIV